MRTKKLTVKRLDNLRKAIYKWDKKWDLLGDLFVYVNGRLYEKSDYSDMGEQVYRDNAGAVWGAEVPLSPMTIIGLSVDGDVYDVLHMNESYYDSAYKEIHALFQKYGLELDFVDNTHLVGGLMDDENVEVEYTWGKRRRIDARSEMSPSIIRNIIEDWDEKTRKVGDSGTCVLGAGLRFIYNGLKYVAHAPSFVQGCLSWEIPLPSIKEELRAAGCTDIIYDSGNMD